MRSIFYSTAGGVKTDEAGAVTGELEVATAVESGNLEVSVRYAGAEDWYTVSGSPVQVGRSGNSDSHRAFHDQALEALTQPGSVSRGNEQPVDIRRLGSESL